MQIFVIEAFTFSLDAFQNEPRIFKLRFFITTVTRLCVDENLSKRRDDRHNLESQSKKKHERAQKKEKSHFIYSKTRNLETHLSQNRSKKARKKD